MNKTLALLLGLALVACSSAEDSADTDKNAAAVKGYGEPTPPPTTPSEPPRPADPEPAPTTPEEPDAPAETCESMRAKGPGGTFTIERLDGATTPFTFVDVEASFRDVTEADGSHTYVFGLTYSTINNLGLYASFGHFPMEASSWTVGGIVTSKTPIADPWHGVFEGGAGGVSTQECKNGAASGFGTDAGDGRSTFTITKSSPDFVEGTFELFSVTMSPILKSTFKAPVRSKTTFTVEPAKQQGFAPKKSICCRVK